MKKSVILLAIGVMVLLLVGAVVFDSVRYVSAARERVAIADEELRTQEERLVKLLEGSKLVTPEVLDAIGVRKLAEDPESRQVAYDDVVSNFRQTMSAEIDPTNPLDRQFMDQIAGAINRRKVAEKQYDLEWQAYLGALGGFRGSVARMISSQARADWPPPR